MVDNELKQRTIKFTDDQWSRAEVIANKLGYNNISTFIRAEIMRIIKEEETDI